MHSLLLEGQMPLTVIIPDAKENFPYMLIVYMYIFLLFFAKCIICIILIDYELILF